jgi:hypothetical protein
MTESRRGRTTTAGRAAASTTDQSSEPVGAPEVPPSPGTDPRATTPLTLTLRLPFLTATLTGPQPGTAAPGPATARRSAGGTLEKLAFYGGVATMGALGALDWPVAVAVAAGTWVAQHTPPVAGTARGAGPREPVGTPEPAGRELAASTAGT